MRLHALCCDAITIFHSHLSMEFAHGTVPRFEKCAQSAVDNQKEDVRMVLWHGARACVPFESAFQPLLPYSKF